MQSGAALDCYTCQVLGFRESNGGAQGRNDVQTVQ